MKTFNLVLSGGGVKSYAHLGVYKYLFEENIKFDEIVAVSGGALIAPFIALRKDPDWVINLFKKTRLHKIIFPFWFVPDKFELLFYQPSTKKVGEWVEKQFTESELKTIKNTNTLHIMATRKPIKEGEEAAYVDMLKIASLKDAISASCAISGIFKAHQVEDGCYVDGVHWNNAPIFFDFKDPSTPLIAVNLGYTALPPEPKGRVSKIFRGYEISSFAKFQEDLKRWDVEKTCKKRGELFVIKPAVWNVNALDFDLTDSEVENLIEAGYKAMKGTQLVVSPSSLLA